MVLPNFGISEQIVHCEDVAYDHSCGNVQPGDIFSSDFFKVTCVSCVNKFAKKYTSAYIVELETELHFFRSSFPRAAENYKRMSAQQLRAADFCPQGGSHEYGYMISPDTVEVCKKCGKSR